MFKIIFKEIFKYAGMLRRYMRIFVSSEAVK